MGAVKGRYTIPTDDHKVGAVKGCCTIPTEDHKVGAVKGYCAIPVDDHKQHCLTVAVTAVMILRMTSTFVYCSAK